MRDFRERRYADLNAEVEETFRAACLVIHLSSSTFNCQRNSNKTLIFDAVSLILSFDARKTRILDVTYSGGRSVQLLGSVTVNNCILGLSTLSLQSLESLHDLNLSLLRQTRAHYPENVYQGADDISSWP